MRRRKLEVHKHLLAEFFRKIDRAELEAELLDISKDGDTLLVGVDYENNERNIITELEELIEDFNEEGEDEDDDEEDDDDEQ